jgi:hypothetical protein
VEQKWNIALNVDITITTALYSKGLKRAKSAINVDIPALFHLFHLGVSKWNISINVDIKAFIRVKNQKNVPLCKSAINVDISRLVRVLFHLFHL